MGALDRRTEIELLPPEPGGLGDPRFRRLLSAVEWGALPEAVRRRFSHRSAPGEAHVYIGRILETRMTIGGLILAHLLRVIGAPLPLERNNTGAAAVVTVTERPDGLGQFWTRAYVRRRGFPQVIHSTKRFSGGTGLEETVGREEGLKRTVEWERENPPLLDPGQFDYAADDRLLERLGRESA